MNTAFRRRLLRVCWLFRKRCRPREGAVPCARGPFWDPCPPFARRCGDGASDFGAESSPDSSLLGVCAPRHRRSFCRGLFTGASRFWEVLLQTMQRDWTANEDESIYSMIR